MASQLDKYFSDVKTPDNITKADIKSIKDWLSKQNHLPELSDRQIAIFIHSCFGALELTKTTIESYFTIRTHAPELFNGRNSKEVAETNNVIYCVRLDDLGKDGCRIVLLGLSNPDPNKFNLANYLRSLFCNLDILYNERSFEEGIRIIYDMTGASFGHLAKFNVSILKKAFTYLQMVLEKRETVYFEPYCEYDLFRLATVLPDLSVDNDNLIIAGFYDENPDKFNVQKALRLFFSIWDIEGNLIPGATGWRVIISAKGFSLGHFTKLTTSLSIIRKVICYLQDGLPLRLKGIHIFNAIPLVNQFLAVVKPIMKKELYQLIKVHPTNNIESLYEYVLKDSLPSTYGGKAPSVEELVKVSNDKMIKYEAWFVDDEKVGRVDETKRAGKAKNSGDIFGFDGSFKKLDFD